LRSSSILAGAQGVNLLVGLLRNKCVAILLGPTGLGLIGLYSSAVGLVGCLSSLGISQSGVRDVAAAAASDNPERVARTVTILRRVVWISGLLGWILTAALSWPLSLWCFGDTKHLASIAVVGATLLIGGISAGQTSLLQGFRRIGDIARLQVAGAVGSTAVSLGFYAWLGERGIVPAFLASAILNLGVSFWFVRRVGIVSVPLSWGETFAGAKNLISLGFAFMWSGLLSAAVALIIQSLVRDHSGIAGNGLYQAAWSISGVFAGFILGAMGTDFYPRLTAAASDHATMNRLVNEQTEVGILLALPGLIGTLCFSPWVIQILYTAEFKTASELLPWFILGIFGRVISWPMGFVQMAKGAGRWFIATESVFATIQVLLAWAGLRWLGLPGIAISFAILYLLYTFGMLWVTNQLSEFRWSNSVVKLLLAALSAVALTFALARTLPDRSIALAVAGMCLTAISGVLCLRQISRRLGNDHRVARLLSSLPGIGTFMKG
jgi:PST family polysaccharide transporter